MIVHTILVAFNNPDQTRTRWFRDIQPSLEHLGYPYRITVVDNSQERSKVLEETFKEDYFWDGVNKMYGPSINFAASRIPSDFILYACTCHGKALAVDWVGELIKPMIGDSRVGMTGFLMGSNSPEGVAHDTKCPWVKERFHFVDVDGNGYVPQHIQGGVFAARTQAMLDHPYHPDIPHLYTDHYVTWAMLKAGWLCWHIPSICSLWRSTADNLNGVKYVHDMAHL